MNRIPLRLCFAFVILAFAGVSATAQESGFDVVKKAPKAKKAQANGPVVVGKAKEGKIVKIWKVAQPGDISDHLVPAVDSIELLSDERMRWRFTVWNKAENLRDFAFSMDRTYVVDDDGETYEPLATEFFSRAKAAIT